jgi:hypothetical protein
MPQRMLRAQSCIHGLHRGCIDNAGRIHAKREPALGSLHASSGCISASSEFGMYGAPERTRTSDTQFRKLEFYGIPLPALYGYLQQVAGPLVQTRCKHEPSERAYKPYFNGTGVCTLPLSCRIPPNHDHTWCTASHQGPHPSRFSIVVQPPP